LAEKARRSADAPNALGWKLLVNTLFGYTAKDVDCAFAVPLQGLGQPDVARGATFSAEFLIKSRRLGFESRNCRPATFRAPRAIRPSAPTIVRAAELFRPWRNIDAN
jgi:hypothetical protein